MIFLNVIIWLLSIFNAPAPAPTVTLLSINGNDDIALEIKNLYSKSFRSEIGKEIKSYNFPVQLGDTLSLRYIKLKNHTIITKFNVIGYYKEYSEKDWDDGLKGVYKKDYCKIPYYKQLPIDLYFIIYYTKDDSYVTFKKPLNYYCEWGNDKK